MIAELDDFNDEEVEELPMQRGLIGQIEECRQPHHFREIIKRSKQAINPLHHLAIVAVRIEFLIENSLVFDCVGTLQEIREELMEYIEENSSIKSEKKVKPERKMLRILEAKKVLKKEKAFKGKTQLLSENVDFIEKNLTLQVWEETKRDKQETARRLGISRGALIQRLINLGAYP